MKKHTLLSTMLFASVGLVAQELKPCKQEEKFAYCDAAGQLRTLAQYTKAMPFQGNLAAAVRDDTWYFINKKGKEVINTRLNYYDDESTPPPVFEKGLLMVSYFHQIHGSVVEYYNRAGKIVKPSVEDFEAILDTIPYTIFEANKAIAYGKTKLGTRYGEQGLDCSGFMRFVYSNYGLTLPFFSHEQALLGEEVDVAEAQKGDLIFFTPYNQVPRKVGHVGMVISEKGQPVQFLHASVSKGVTINNLSDVYYKQRFIAIRRIIF